MTWAKRLFIGAASVLVVLDRRRAKKSGLYPVKVEVVYRRRQKYYPTGQDMSETEWMCFPARTSMEVAAMIDDRFYRQFPQRLYGIMLIYAFNLNVSNFTIGQHCLIFNA